MERGVRPMGDWSTSYTDWIDSWPVRREAEPVVRGPWSLSREFRAAMRAGSRHSRIRVLLPEPLTPVTKTKRPRGKRTVRPLRLFLFASRSASQAGEEGRGSACFCLLRGAGCEFRG